MNVTLISEILETYEGRDKFLKTFSYAAKLGTLFAKSPETLKKISKFGSKMSECRVILRLMDDIPILNETLTYGWGKKEPDNISRFLKLSRNLVDLVATPIEHICWFGEQKFFKTDENHWDNISTRLWILYLCLSLMIKLGEIEFQKGRQLSENRQNEERRKTKKLIDSSLNNQLLTCLRLSLDLSYAISYLPSGNLWGCRLKTWQIGLLGTLSSIIGLYQLFKKFPQPVISSLEASS